jgi:hypothetical protein
VTKPKDTLVINKQCRSEMCSERLVDVSHQLTAQLMHVAEQTLEACCRGITSRKHTGRRHTDVMSEWNEREVENMYPGVFVRQI